MKNLKMLIAVICSFCLFPISHGFAQHAGPKVDIITSKGTITVMLYDETPLHRDNFLKLVKENFYNNMLYHRIINGFIIQIGDPASRKGVGENYVPTEEGVSIPPEIKPEFFHRRGALNAAREGESINPYLKSSATHFTIIQGRVQNDSTLNRAEKRIESFYRAHLDALYKAELTNADPELSKETHATSLQALVDEKIAVTMKDMGTLLKIPEAHREVYKTLGGAPHLDYTYTVFGEVLEGMDVVDAIAAVPTEKERPTEEVYIIRMELRK